MLLVERSFTIRLQYVHIEETVAFEIYSCKYIVVQGNFRHIYVLCVTCCKKHSVVEEYVTYCCTGFVVCLYIRKIIFRSESLISCHGAKTSVDVDLGICDIVPEGIQCRQKCGICIM